MVEQKTQTYQKKSNVNDLIKVQSNYDIIDSDDQDQNEVGQ